jgi:hypothetical protein
MKINTINTMNYNIFYEDKTNLKNIKFGKKQIFNNKTYIPIYYNDQQSKKTNNHNDFILKSPRLFIPNKVRKENGFKPTIETIMIPNDDEGIQQFIDILTRIEKMILTKYKKQKKLNLKHKTFISYIKDDNKYKTKKLYIPLNIFTSSCIDINNKLINEWDFIAPTYGYFIIQLKNIWIDENKWGINIFCNGGMILPSQFMDPPPIPVEKIQYLFQSEIDGLKTIGDDERYSKFFKMKKMGIPLQAIKNKMLLEHIPSNIIDLDPSTTLSNLNDLKININSLHNSSTNTLNLISQSHQNTIDKSSLLVNNFVENNNNSNNSNNNIHSELCNELLSKSGNFLKKSNHNSIHNSIHNKINNLNHTSIKKDDRIPSLDQIKDAIGRMKSKSIC